MGVFDFVDDIGEAIEDGVENVVEGAGELIDDGLDLVAEGADAIGLDDAAEALDDFGDEIASATGGDVEERELGESEDPTELILGNPAEIGSTAQTLNDMSAALESTGEALKQIDSANWVGDGADAFNEVYDKQPKLWFDGADAMADAAAAMTAWHNVVKTAQGKAADAIDEWKAAAREEQRVISWWNSLTGEQQAQTTVVDTWTPMRNNARAILRNARIARDNGATVAVSAISAATDKAPAEPPFTDRWLANLSDLGGVLEHGALNFMSGLLTSLTGLVQFVRQINPFDTYNMTHPADYLEGLSNLGTGLVVAAADPGAAVSAILEDARRNPFEFMGALTGDALLTAATGGAGSAKFAVSAMRRLADAGQAGRRLDDLADLGRHLPGNSAPNPHTPDNPPGHPSQAPNQAGPAPDAGHTPDTNPMDAGGRPDSDGPGSGDRTSDSPAEPPAQADPPRERDTDDDPVVGQLPDHTPDDSPAARPDNDPPAQTDTDSPPPQSPTPDPDRTPDPDPPGPGDDPDPPLQRTDPRPDAADPSAHTDRPSTTPGDSSPTSHTPGDSNPHPATHEDPPPSPVTHTDTDPSTRPDHSPTNDAPRDSTPDTPRDSTPDGSADQPSPHPETGSPDSRNDIGSRTDDPGHAPPPHSEGDPSSPRPDRDADDTPVDRPEDSDSPAPRTNTELPGVRDTDQQGARDTDGSPETRTDPDRAADSRPTPGTRPDDSTDTPSPYLAPGTHTGPGSPALRSDPGPDTRTPDPGNQPRSPDTSSPARTRESAPASRAPESSSPARTLENTSNNRAPARPGPTTRADPDASSRARPTPDSSPATRPDHDSPDRKPEPGERPGTPPDTPDGRTPRDGTHPRTGDNDTPRSPTRRDDPDSPTDRTRPDRDTDDNPRDRHPRDRDHDPERRDPDHRDRDPEHRDRHPDKGDHDTPRDRDSDTPDPHDRADADRDAHEHARESGADHNRTPEQKTCSTDPVDISTGEFLLPETDIELAGVLPLLLKRAHHSNYRFGRWFGPSWATTLDTRIAVTAEGVVFFGEDGVLLAYPHAEAGFPAPPLTGGRQWSLTRTDAGGYRVWDRERELTWHFAPEPVLDGLDTALGNYAVSAVTDRHHNRIRFHYDSRGVPVEVSHSGGYRIRVDSTGGRITGLALRTEETDSPAAIPLRTFAYDAGELVAVTNAAGATTRYTYDTGHRLTSWTDSNGNRMVNTYDDSGRVVRQRGSAGMLNCDFDYLELPDGTGRLTRVTDSRGAVTTHGFDRDLQLRDLITPDGARFHYDYNIDRKPLTVTGPDPATRTRYVYNADGDPTTITRPDGATIEMEYALPNRTAAITGADGAVYRREWSDTGDLTAVLDAPGARTEFTHHPNGAVATFTSGGGTTVVDSDAAGLPIRIVDPHGGVTRIERDAAGRPVRTVTADGSATRYEWSAAGNLLCRKDPDGTEESWSYDGEDNLIGHTDRAGGVTEYRYGVFDLIRSRTDPDGSVTRYEWDTERRLTAVHNPLGQRWNYEYDLAGQLIAETDYSAATTTYTRDSAGRVASVTPATGTTRYHRHDIMGRLTEIGTDTGDWIRYTRDPAGRILDAAAGTGGETTHTIEYSYSATGLPTIEQVDDRPPMRYTYDLHGRRAGRTAPTGTETGWHHDTAGRIDRLGAGDHEITVEYDSLGRRTGWRTGEISVTRALDPAGRVTRQIVTAFPAPLLSLDLGQENRPAPHRLRRDEFDYRPDGPLTAHTTTRPGSAPLQRHYALDIMGRVTAVTADGRRPTEAYTYDALGNIIAAQRSLSPSETDSAAEQPDSDSRREYDDNLLVHDGRYSYRYDPAGRLIRKTATGPSGPAEDWFYRYNGFDQLTDVYTPTSQWWQYTYDALGRRTTKQRLDTTGTVLERTDYAWDGNRLIECAEPGTTTRWEYLPGSHIPVTQTIHRDGSEPELAVIVTDLVGTPAHLVDPRTGDTLATATTDLWGRTMWSGATGTPLRFPGQFHDPETGLHYNRHRFYDPETGRFLTRDPLGLSPAPNPHIYPHNPTVWSDPLGLIPRSCETDDTPDREPDPDPGDPTPHDPTPTRPTVDTDRVPDTTPAAVRDPDAGTSTGRPGTGDDPPDGPDPHATRTVTETQGRNTATWTLNSDGKPIRAVAKLKEVFKKAERSNAEESAANKIGKSGGRTDDHGGHVVDHRFMLDQLFKNMFPQNGNFNTSAYKVMANEWSSWVDNGCEVRPTIELLDGHGNPVQGTNRPDRVTVEYEVYGPDGKLLYDNQVRFKNEADQKFDRLRSKQIKKMIADGP
ncbi:putative T7SS-secreted protein [Nocardia sp. NPDC024068]|uniref:putative T7SS-secreted protein n=1 Tax=Nocardia sp. NPDC024068 TaxID=3157197 RepID=UPI0033FBCE93